MPRRTHRTPDPLAIDLAEWLRPGSGVSLTASMVSHVIAIVESASVTEGGPTAVGCRRADAQPMCFGLVVTAVEDDVVRWHCDGCADSGAIRSWRRTEWDLSDVEIGTDDADVGIYLPRAELAATRGVRLDRGLRAVLAAAVPVDAMHAAVMLTEDELAGLLAALVGTAVHGDAQRLVDRVLGRMDQARLQHQLARRVAAH